jgi:peptidoglycan/xylan/chitin deacetylase (PgdA/CDA1 family)
MQRTKGRIKSLVGQTIFLPRLHHLLLSNAAVVVAFHRVNNTTVGDRLTCSVEIFERYCRFFANYFRVVSLGQLVKKLEVGAPLNRELAITFDDGYRDNYEYAAPVLKALGLPATFFVVSQFMNTEFVPWWDESLSVHQPWMTWDQVQWLGREGFEIGAHTRTHINLGEASGSEAWDEILGSRLELEEKLSTRIDLFAYPYGKENDISEETREMTKAAGFRCCCSCFGGVNPMGADPYYLRRIPMSSWYTSPHHFGFEVALRRA